jgi:hypothetical protein
MLVELAGDVAFVGEQQQVGALSEPPPGRGLRGDRAGSTSRGQVSVRRADPVDRPVPRLSHGHARPGRRAQFDQAGFQALHSYFLERLVPVCAQLLDSAAEAGEFHTVVEAHQLMRGFGNLCVGADADARHDARRLVEVLLVLRRGAS